MKNKKIILSLLAFSLLMMGLAGCSSNDNDDIDKDNAIVDETENEVSDEKEESEVKEDIEESEVKEENQDVSDKIDQMISESDYISKVKLITKGKNKTEIKVLDNIKDVILAKDLPELDLKENRAYLVFLKDDGGEAVLVNEDDSLVLLEGDNHELFERINKQIYQ